MSFLLDASTLYMTSYKKFYPIIVIGIFRKNPKLKSNQNPNLKKIANKERI